MTSDQLTQNALLGAIRDARRSAAASSTSKSLVKDYSPCKNSRSASNQKRTPSDSGFPAASHFW